MLQYTNRKKFYRNKFRLKRQLKKLLPIIAIAGYLYYLLLGPYGFINICRLKKEELSLKRKKERLLEEREALSDSLIMIQKDTFLLEKLAREKLGMIMPGDTVILNIEE